MKKIILSGLVSSLLATGVYAGTKDSTINFYGVGAKLDKDKNSHAGVGFMYDSEEIKVKLEGTSDFIKAGAVVKFNPYNDKWYVKVGANIVNQKM